MTMTGDQPESPPPYLPSFTPPDSSPCRVVAAGGQFLLLPCVCVYSVKEDRVE